MGLLLPVANSGSDSRLPLSGASPGVETQQYEKREAVPVQSLVPVVLEFPQMMQFFTAPPFALTAATVPIPVARLSTSVQFSTVPLPMNITLASGGFD